ncbi:S9 family peptidase [Microvirga antarctica]|uniref:S9 family peptidase n=1 Tax=Microvirga antarctica TaxID=2819233 RepID=UPI001B30B5EB|nr:S9 family peptidase [Microvirga antarctica]
MTVERLPFPTSLPVAPVVPSKQHSFLVHGRQISDEFAWLKDPNWQDVLKDPAALDPAIRTVLERENAYTAAVFDGTADFQQTLVAEMRGRVKEDDSSVPEPDGPFAYFTRYREGGQHPLVCRQPRDGGAETLLLDCDKEAEGQAFFDLGGADQSPDHRLMAWGADVKGSEYFTIKVRDLETGQDQAHTLLKTSGGVVWLQDASGFYYVELDDNHRPVRVRRHMIGTTQDADAVVYEEPDSGFFVQLGLTQSGAFVLIEASDHETSEVHLLDRTDPMAVPRLVEPRTVALQYDVEHHGDRLIILTNADGAEDFKIVTAPVATPGRAHWQDLVVARPGVMVLFAMALSRHLVRLEREDARPRIVVRDFASGHEEVIGFDEEAFSLSVDPGYEYDTAVIRYRYSSMTTPSEVTDLDLDTGTRILRKRQVVPSGHRPEDYVTRRLFATAPDGAQVPISIVHRRDTPLDGTAPCLLYGYGSYGMSMSAGFRTNILSLVDRGFVYAIAHIRGGTEKGWRWYLNGKRDKKLNTFTDFIACGEHLAASGYTSRGRIVAHGGSAGGMLMGAVANLAPSLFAGIVSEVPFVDVLNTMLDADLPLTPPEWPEWGNPAADEDAFRTILSYSPYDNVRRQAYPAILALAGLTDPRVTYWEPAKWIARLRERMEGGGPVMLKMNMDAGHGGAAGRFDRLEEVALSYLFALRSIEGFEN